MPLKAQKALNFHLGVPAASRKPRKIMKDLRLMASKGLVAPSPPGPVAGHRPAEAPRCRRSPPRGSPPAPPRPSLSWPRARPPFDASPFGLQHRWPQMLLGAPKKNVVPRCGPAANKVVAFLGAMRPSAAKRCVFTHYTKGMCLWRPARKPCPPLAPSKPTRWPTSNGLISRRK